MDLQEKLQKAIIYPIWYYAPAQFTGWQLHHQPQLLTTLSGEN
jgi:hypothetical protein